MPFYTPAHLFSSQTAHLEAKVFLSRLLEDIIERFHFYVGHQSAGGA